MNKTWRRFWGHRIRTDVCRGIVLTVGLLAAFDAPLFAAGSGANGRLPSTVIYEVSLHLAAIFTAICVFCLGACLGSFLNVVIYRLPAGLGLILPASRCPHCETELSARDNIPIVAWLLLGGRCRYCQAPISPRYLLVELTVGLLFVGLLLLHIKFGARTLPFQPDTALYGEPYDIVVSQGRWDLFGMFLWHGCFLTVLLATSLIACDGHAPPRSLIWFGLITAAVVSLVWPELRPVHVTVPLPNALQHYWGISWRPPGLHGSSEQITGIGIAGLVDTVAGVTSGMVTGWLAARVLSGSHASVPASIATGTGMLLTGVWCGWQMTWPLLTMILVATAVARGARRNQLISLAPLLLFCCALVCVTCWNLVCNGIWMIRYDGWRWTPWAAPADWGVTIAVIAGAALLLSRRSAIPEAELEAGAAGAERTASVTAADDNSPGFAESVDQP